MKTVYLTGFMGSGKTTVGALLGEALGVPVIDTDHVIEEQQGKRITEIFAEEGEAAFRAYEKDVLRTMPSFDAVVTTGGGLPMAAENRAYMAEHGTVVFLHCPLEVIFERLEGDETRPLFDAQKKEEMISLFQARLPHYQNCDLEVNTGGHAAQATVAHIVRSLQEKK
ncbi:shikimate kinase [Fictibacillus macauensis ZFHKF-1]|uniref:Shikimate kinase n=1 Tax=Fictibacillus macauensis ZFHKF-1 TaxID=1196324 RepID=I8AGI5_9BACL|nr:shikimate kinase [Fictibacillus macauensis]EIT84494.1 shikimate kinase [Fictibacillus macauensis ZFHKF-1]